MIYAIYGLIVLSAIGMGVGLMQQKNGKEWGRPLAIGCAVVALIFAMTGTILYIIGMGGEGVVNSEANLKYIAARHVSKHLAEKYSGQKWRYRKCSNL